MFNIVVIQSTIFDFFTFILNRTFERENLVDGISLTGKRANAKINNWQKGEWENIYQGRLQREGEYDKKIAVFSHNFFCIDVRTNPAILKESTNKSGLTET